MPEIKNNFSKGSMNKDLDERIIPNGQYRDAMNIQVSTSEDSDVGTAQNILGNTVVNSLQKDRSDVIGSFNTLFDDSFKCVASIADEKNDTLYYFISSTTLDAIIEYKTGGEIVTPVLVDTKASTNESVLKFSNDNIITGINIIDNLLFWTDNNTEPKKINIDRCKEGSTAYLTNHTKLMVDGQDLGDIKEEHITVIKKRPTKAPTIQTELATEFDDEGNPINGEFIFEKVFARFACRYKYIDGEYSAFGPFTEVVFEPDQFEYDVKEPYNKGMSNKIIKIHIKDFVAADIPDEVVQVDILYKEEDSTVVYSIDSIRKDDPIVSNQTTNHWHAEGSDVSWGGGTYTTVSGYKGSYTVTNENIYAALPENQLLRPCDNVPKKALAQDITGNRIVYGNYLQGYNLTTINNTLIKPNLNSGYIERKFGDANDDSISIEKGTRSIKSLRNYQLGVVYGDKYGRETPVFTGENASFVVPWKGADKNASRSNQIYSTLYGDPPSWAEYYKFFIKETSSEYYNVVMDRVYMAEEEGTLWISLPSSEINKIKEDDYMILKKSYDDPVQVTWKNKLKVVDIKTEAPDSVKYKYVAMGSAGGSSANLSDIFPEDLECPAQTRRILRITKEEWFNQASSSIDQGDNPKFHLGVPLFITFSRVSGSNTILSKKYKIVQSVLDGTEVVITLEQPIDETDAWVNTVSGDPLPAGAGVSSLQSNLMVTINKQELKSAEEFDGRFFVKIKSNNTTQMYIEPHAGQSVNTVWQGIAGPFSLFWWADQQSGVPALGICNATWTWSQPTNSVKSVNGNKNLTNTRGAWDSLATATGYSNGGWFIDSMYMAAGQKINKIDVLHSGRMWRGGNPSAGAGSNGSWIVNGLEGIIKATNKHAKIQDDNSVGTGIRRWLSNIGDDNSMDDTYGSIYLTDKYYMHISFYAPGKDLHDGVFVETHSGNGRISISNTGNDTWENNMRGISSSDTSDWTNPNTDPSGVPYSWFTGGGAYGRYIHMDNKNYWEGENYRLISGKGHEALGFITAEEIANQWNPAYNNSANQARIDNLVPNSKFKFQGDPNETIYTIKRKKVKRLYNHTPWNKMYKWDGFTGGNMVPRGDSVEEAAVAWGEAIYAQNGAAPYLETVAGGIAPEEQTLRNKLISFGKRSNRRVCYICEITPNPKQQTYNPLNGGSSANIQASGSANKDIIQFVESGITVEVELSSDNPDIFETEPKSKSGLDIYYEASQAIPTSLDANSTSAMSQGLSLPDNSKSELYAPIGCKVWCNSDYYDSNSNTIPRIKSWDGNEVTFYPETGLPLDPNFANSDAGQSDAYNGKLLRFYRDDLSFTTARIYSVSNIISFFPDAPAGSTSVAIEAINKVIVGRETLSRLVGLPYYNCFTFGNGIESDRVRDDFNQMQFSNGVKASAVLETQYKEEHRKNGLIYSGLYNSVSGINNLNQFIQAEKITKDLNPTYGSIQKLFQRRVNLVAFCEDRVVKILSFKDALYNADGNAQLVSTSNVLGEASPFVGDYGISTNPESFAKESYRAYFTDKQRGAVCRLSMDGITPISEAGMSDYFKDNLPLSNKLFGSYDNRKKDYNLTLLDPEYSHELLRNTNFSLVNNAPELIRNQDFASKTYGPNFVPNSNFNAGHSTWGLFSAPRIEWVAQGSNYGIVEWNNAINYDKMNLNLDHITSLGSNPEEFFVDGRKVEVEFKISNYTQGALYVKLFGGNRNSGPVGPGATHYIPSPGDIPNATTTGGGVYIFEMILSDSTPANNNTENGRFFIGNDPNTGGGIFSGRIDNVRIREVKAWRWERETVTTMAEDWNWTTGRSKASHAYGYSYLIQNLDNPLLVGKEYELIMDVGNVGSGTFSLANVGDPSVNNGSLNINVVNNKGSVIFEQLTTSNLQKIQIYNTPSDKVEIDNISLKLLANPTYWIIDSLGGNYVRKSTDAAFISGAVRLYHKNSNSSHPTNIKSFENVLEVNKIYKWSIEINKVNNGAISLDPSQLGITANIVVDGSNNTDLNTVGIHTGTIEITSSNSSAPPVPFTVLASANYNNTDITFTNVSLQRQLNYHHETVTFSEDVRGWVSFKSFIPENALSMANNYYTFKNSMLYKHHDENVNRNTFYGVHEDSSITPVLNIQPNVVKNFNTLNYEGTQSRVDEFTTVIQDGVSYEDGNYYNLNSRLGWFVDSITTDLQTGTLNEFIEKENKLFNYIKGNQSVIDPASFNFQGIGVCTNVSILTT